MSDNNIGPGQLLRHAREQRGLTLDQIASETKISRRQLEALERDNLTTARDAFYRRAQIRAYAQAVRLDHNLVLAELDRTLTPSQTSEPEAETPRARRSIRAYGSALIVACVVALAVFGFAKWTASPEPEQWTPVTPLLAPSDSVTGISIEPANVAVASDAGLAAPPHFVAPPLTPEAPAPGESATELVVTTEPSGARVTVDGIGWGTSPITIRYLSPGDKRIRVSKEGYATEERVFQVVAGQPRGLDIQLADTP